MPKHERHAEKRHSLGQQGTLNLRPQSVTHPLFQENEFFDPHDLVQVKYEMLRQVRIDKQSVSQSAKAFGFSRPSFYQAHFAFEHSGLTGLVPQKRGPKSGHKLTPEVMEFLTQAQADDPSLRLDQLAQLVQRRFHVEVHPRSIERQLRHQKKRQ